jgi:hypothetical protein
LSVAIPSDRRTLSTASTSFRATAPRLLPLEVVVLSICCGLASGLLEVGTRVVTAGLFSNNRQHSMSRHFIWLVPLSDLMLFSILGLVLALVAKVRPRFGAWFGPRLIGFLAILPVLMVSSPRIHREAWVLLAQGAAVRLASWLERWAARLRRDFFLFFPACWVCFGS